MSSLTTRGNSLTQQEKVLYAVLIVAGMLALIYSVLWIGNVRAGEPTEGLALNFALGRSPWTPEHTTVVLVLAAVVAVAWPVLWWADRRMFGPRKPVTRAARYFASPWKARKLTWSWVCKDIKRKDGGVYKPFSLGYLSRTTVRIYIGPEDTIVIVTGPRQNKSTSLANPAIVDAPGAVLSTSNKPDPVYDTLKYRAKGGVYIFDPQNLYAGDVPTPIYWDMLSYIRNAADVHKIEKASTLAHRILFAAGAMSSDDKHWGNSAKNIMAAMLLAATISNRPVTDVYRWILAPSDSEPVRILNADGRFPMIARTLDEYAHHPGDQRGGEYGTAQTALSFLSYDSVIPWITPGPGRTEFDPEVMVAGGKPTLYVLSQEGEGSTGPLTAALTIAVYEAADRAAMANGGRLPVPFDFVLDEVANVAPWEALPELMTHMGSKGIRPWLFFQNYSQGKRLWGEDRMKVLLSVCGIFITGGNIKDDGFHRAVMDMLPSYSRRTVTESTGRNGGGQSISETDDKVLDVSDLRMLPKEYSLMFAANTAPVILRHIPMWRRGYRKPKTAPAVPATSAPVFHREHPQPSLAPRPRSSGWDTTLTVEGD